MRPKLLLCEPRFYRVAYVINPWMAGNVGRVDPAEALDQWEGLCAALAEHADLELLEPDPAQPDMTFVANAGLISGGVFVPARFRFRERQGEKRRFRSWAESKQLRIVDIPPGITFEGEGDALLQPGEALLWGGYGVRTSLRAYRSIAAALDVEVVPLHLIDERFYHLDTCFCPLPDGRVLFYPEAFSRSSLEAIRARVPAQRRLEVDAGDGLGFACNAVLLDRTVVLPHASAALCEALARWELNAIVRPLSQFMLAGGAAKCLTLYLDHPPAGCLGGAA